MQRNRNIAAAPLRSANGLLLIDEYDVPVAKANNNGYYNEMLDVMKGLMQALKDNQALRFAVVTGCLKIAKESIFTGTNNFVSDTTTNSRLNEYFGFVQSGVGQLLKDADLTEQAENIKKWYDGYHFGDFDVYCPWDVMNYMLELQRNPKAKPISYWKNTSDNAIIRSFIDYTPKATVQAAIGGIPLALGFACGDTVLTVAVLAIVLTAPLGAFAMDLSYKRLLKKEQSGGQWGNEKADLSLKE